MKTKSLFFLIISSFLILGSFSNLYSQTGPGGVGSTATNGLWLRADDISQADNSGVSAWVGASNYSHVASPGDSNDTPLFFNTSALNNMPIVRFDGIANQLVIPDADILDDTQGISYYTVLRPNNLNGAARGVLGKRITSGDLIDYSYTWFFWNGNNLVLDVETQNNRFGTSSVFVNNTNYILSWDFDGTKALAERSRIRNGSEVDVASNETSTAIGNSNKDLVIGALNYNYGTYLGADYAEIIQFSYALNNTEHIIVQNYLSAKYDIAITTNNLYTQDDNANGDFDFNVAGIGQETSSDNHIDSKGSGIIRINTPSALSDGDYLFWGEETNHSSTYTFSTSTDYVERIDSKWRVSKTDNLGVDLGTVSVSVKESDLDLTNKQDCASLKLVVSDSYTFATKTSYDFTLSAGIYTVTGINFTDGDYFSLEYIDEIVLDDATWYNLSVLPNTSCYKFLMKNSANYSFNTDYDIREIEVESGCTLTIDKNINITTGDINNSGTFTIKSDASGTGSLITNGAITNSGIFEVQRWIDAGKTWQLVSSPMEVEKANSFYGNYLNSYNEVLGDFDAIINPNTPLGVADGYVSKLDETLVGHVENPMKFNLSKPNTNDVSIALKTNTWSSNLAGSIISEDGTWNGYANTHFDLADGFNLVGNPYPSSVNWNKVYEANSGILNSAYYRYNDSLNGSGAWDPYLYNDPSTDSIINIGQGFGVILSANADNTMTIPNTSRTHDVGAGFGKKSSTTPKSFNLVASADELHDDVNFRLNEESTSAYDGKYDAYKFNSFGDTPTPYFVSSDNKRLAICQQPETESVDVGFNMAISGEVTFSLSNVQDFTEIVLEDKQKGTFTDLIKSAYSFNYSDEDAETGRFTIHFEKGTLSEVEELDYLNIYSSASNLYLKSDKRLNNVNISIYNVSGQQVLSKHFDSLTNKEINTGLQGVYILKLTSDKGNYTTKLILN